MTEIAFADEFIAVPAGLDGYSTIVDLRPDIDCVAEIDVALDRGTRELTATLTAIDPATGWLPEDLLIGLLYPNDDTGRGEGHISFLVRPVAGLPTGARIENKARIVFDWNDPIDTPVVVNTIDADAPGQPGRSAAGAKYPRRMSPSPGRATTAAGSGIARYDVYVSDNGGESTLWGTFDDDASATFTGETGHTYAFYSVAIDNVGLRESPPSTADTQTTILVPGACGRRPARVLQRQRLRRRPGGQRGRRRRDRPEPGRCQRPGAGQDGPAARPDGHVPERHQLRPRASTGSWSTSPAWPTATT